MSKVRRYVVDAMDEDEDGEVVFYDCYQKLQEDYDYIKRELESACERAEYKKELLEENIKLTGQVATLRSALVGLKKEIGGLMSAHRVVLGYDYGNSNCQVIDFKIKEIDEMLAKLEQDEWDL